MQKEFLWKGFYCPIWSHDILEKRQTQVKKCVSLPQEKWPIKFRRMRFLHSKSAAQLNHMLNAWKCLQTWSKISFFVFDMKQIFCVLCYCRVLRNIIKFNLSRLGSMGLFGRGVHNFWFVYFKCFSRGTKSLKFAYMSTHFKTFSEHILHVKLV